MAKEKGYKVPENSYINIQAFMINDLELKDKELLVYALIYGFTQDGEDWFTGSMQYIGNWLGMDSRNIYSRYLKPLIDKGLLIKESEIKNNQVFPKYKAIIPNCDPPSQNVTPPHKRGGTPSQNVSIPPHKLGDNNLTNNLEDNIEFINNNENLNSNKQNKDYKEIYKSNNTAIIDKHGNSVVEKKKTSKGFDVSRFINSPTVALQISRFNEATFDNKLSNSVVQYVADSCNCFGIKQLKIINQFTDDEYEKLFKEALGLIDNDPYYVTIENKKAYLSSVISKCISNHVSS